MSYFANGSAEHLTNGLGKGAERYVYDAVSPLSGPPVPGSMNGHGRPVREKEKEANGGTVDAGLRSLDHYKRALPAWRYNLRQRMLPLVRWETPYLAYLQSIFRTPALDSYFAITANLGTHTFFMIGLPILFWCGYPAFGKGLVHILAFGVFFTGWIKDFASLPRPLSPPLHRITMSGSAALEYGFPSTHSANAVSVAVYGILLLHSPDNTLPAATKLFLESLAYFYAFSIVIGRLYCGMHGFLDVIIGSAFGAIISLAEFYYGPQLETALYNSGWMSPAIIALAIIVLVRVHPEPADDCPCFDDSVAFAGVVIGLEAGMWMMYGPLALDVATGLDLGAPLPSVASLVGWPVMIVRVVLGVLIVFAWREVMKPALLRGLPHLFRLIERAGLSLPRRFFKPASQYKTVPENDRIDTLLPSVSDIPRVVESIRHPKTRGRSISIGPQSAADAYETLAYRERRRRESVGSNASLYDFNDRAFSVASTAVQNDDRDGTVAQVSGAAPGRTSSKLAEFEAMMGQGQVVMTPGEGPNGMEVLIGARQGDEEQEVFSRLIQPRVRYDVEVVTKLVVYTGIAWFATAGIPIIFELIGLGYGHLLRVR